MLVYNNRQISFGEGGGSEHITGGEGPIMSRHFDVRPGDWVVDVGAGDSSWTLYALASGAARVYAFEPSVPRFKKLVLDVLANDGFFERTSPRNEGLGAEDTVATLEDWYEKAGGPGFEVSPDCKVQTRFLPLDHFEPEMPRLDWIKMDVEGGELFVMLGGRKLLARRRPKMIIENHIQIGRIGKWMKANMILDRIYNFLHALDYEVMEDSCENTIGRTFIIATPR